MTYRYDLALKKKTAFKDIKTLTGHKTRCVEKRSHSWPLAVDRFVSYLITEVKIINIFRRQKKSLFKVMYYYEPYTRYSNEFMYIIEIRNSNLFIQKKSLITIKTHLEMMKQLMNFVKSKCYGLEQKYINLEFLSSPHLGLDCCNKFIAFIVLHSYA